jgi:Ca2+-binding EF-hand superfamily protein
MDNKKKKFLNESQIEEAKYAFDLLDISKDGTISITDIRKILKEIGQEENDEKKIIKMFEDELGKTFSFTQQEKVYFSFNDYLKLMNKKFKDEDLVNELNEAFRILGGQDKLISIKSLCDNLIENGETLSKKELEDLILALDEKNEYINYEELINTYFSIK